MIHDQEEESNFPYRFVGMSMLASILMVTVHDPVAALLFPLGFAWSVARVLYEAQRDRQKGYR